MTFFNYFFLSLLGLCSFLVISSKNPLHSILSLVSVFLLSSILALSLEAEFLALSFVLVYVGAIAILFLFVVIMLDIKMTDSSFDLKERVFVYFVIFILLVDAQFMFPQLNFDPNLISYTDFTWINWCSEIDNLSNAQLLGQILYTYYFVFFLIAGLILFVALIGSLMLTIKLNKFYKIS